MGVSRSHGYAVSTFGVVDSARLAPLCGEEGCRKQIHELQIRLIGLQTGPNFRATTADGVQTTSLQMKGEKGTVRSKPILSVGLQSDDSHQFKAGSVPHLQGS
jgi:hypothetical protein